MEYLHWVGAFLVYALMGLLCLAGLVLSAFSLSGTWCVVAAAGIGALWRTDPFPGAWTVGSFAAIALLVEGIEWFASWKGVTSRGGSAWSGLAACAGAIAGAALLAPFPPPLVASLVGAVAGAFGGAYGAEYLRWKRSSPALRVAWGTVIARLIVTVVKVAVTFGMAVFLVLGMAF